MTEILMDGHPAWIWVDLDGRGARWHLAVPTEREDWDQVDEDDDETCRWQALFPFDDGYRCEVTELIGLPARPIAWPRTPPTPDEIEQARREEREHFGSDVEDDA
jgi:hypothetical protein